MSLTFWSFITGIVLMAPFALPRLPASIPAQAWLMFTVLGTVCTALPVLFFVKSLKFMKAQNASMGALLLAVTVPALGLLVGEIPNSESITGGIFIVAGIAFSMKAET